MAASHWFSLLLIACFSVTGLYGQLNVCGRPTAKRVTSRIAGGQKAPLGSWPWMASLHRYGRHFCAGSLINNQWVLTAAHCFESTNPKGLFVYLGRQAQLLYNPMEEYRTVVRIVLHPQYQPLSNDIDVALLRLSSPVRFTNFIRPVCLAGSNSVFHSGEDSWVTGWGAVREGVRLPFPQWLQQVQVPVVGDRQCKCQNGVTRVTNNMMCAGLQTGGKDSCQGDSGAPLVNVQNGVYIQSGISSWGFGCAQPELPGVYTRVSRYQEWIEMQVTGESPGFVTFLSSGTDPDSSYSCPGLTLPNAEEEEPTAKATTNDSSANVCGTLMKVPTPRIVGGEDAPPGSWPWLASLHRSGVHVCGGSLINKEWVMTAAHCFVSTDISGLTVYLGRHSQLSTNPNEVSRNIAEVVFHPSYANNDNDVALLRLSSPVQFTNFIRPVCLAASGSVFNSGTISWLAGWGDMSEDVPLPFPQTLQEVEVPVVGNRQCNCLNGVRSVTDNMICAGLLRGGKDACVGDSGGPMMSQQDKKWVQSGVVSWGIGCAEPGLPGVHSRVSRFQSWISSTIQSDPPGFIVFSTPGPDADSGVTCPELNF